MQKNAERKLLVPKPATLLSTSATLLVRWKEDNLHFRKWAIVVIYFYRPLVLFMTNCTSSVLQVFHFAFCASVRSFKARVRSFQGIRAHKKRAHSTTYLSLALACCCSSQLAPQERERSGESVPAALVDPLRDVFVLAVVVNVQLPVAAVSSPGGYPNLLLGPRQCLKRVEQQQHVAAAEPPLLPESLQRRRRRGVRPPLHFRIR